MTASHPIPRLPVAQLTAFFGLSNRIANVISMRPNDEFFLKERVPRK
jgi:hypothetical protein